MLLSIFAITFPNPGAPPGIYMENFHHSRALHHNICPGGGDFFGLDPEGWVFVYKRFFHFWSFHCYHKNWRQTTLRGFKKYLLLSNFMFFKKTIKLQASCQKSWWKFSFFHETQTPVKSVCINNDI